MLKLLVANAIELGWQGTRLNVLYGKLRGGHCASQVYGYGSCSQNIAIAFRGPGTFIEALGAAQEQFKLCSDLATGGGCTGNQPQPGDLMCNCSHVCREGSPRWF